jgi:large subunit ribosomal protein L15
MQIHQLKPNHKNKTRKRVGRGGKRGTYSGKGLKGQSSRAGRKFVPAIREYIKKYPKLKGYKAKRFINTVAILNLTKLEKYFESSSVINPQILIEKRLIRRIGGRIPSVKILGTGDITKKLVIEDCLVSKSAKEKIESEKKK